MPRSHVGKTEPFSGGLRDYASGGRCRFFPGEGGGWVGLEPTTNALKGRCSTIELPTRTERSVLIQLGECRKTRFRRGPSRSGAEQVGAVAGLPGYSAGARSCFRPSGEKSVSA